MSGMVGGIGGVAITGTAGIGTTMVGTAATTATGTAMEITQGTAIFKTPIRMTSTVAAIMMEIAAAKISAGKIVVVTTGISTKGAAAMRAATAMDAGRWQYFLEIRAKADCF